MIRIFDGNNVMLRAMTTQAMSNEARISLRQRLADAGPSDIWVWDGENHNARRQAIYPRYKTNREPMAENHFSQIRMFRDLLRHTAATQVTVNGWEADDCIATIAKRTTAPISIFTNDADYFQLAVLSHVTLKGVAKQEFEPEWTPLYKAMNGDSSDFIAGIPGFGPKAWANTEGYRLQIKEAIHDGRVPDFPCTPRVRQWLKDPANLAELKAMLHITHMWDVPEEEINRGVVKGEPNPTLIDEALRRYFL